MTFSLDAAVLIGRFQPLHHGHLSGLRHALAQAPRCVVVIASAHQARTPRNPFTWEERAALLRQSLSASERERVTFVPAREPFHLPRWVRQVQASVLGALGLPAATATTAANETPAPSAGPRIGVVSLLEDSLSHQHLHAQLRVQTGWLALPAPPAPGLPDVPTPLPERSGLPTPGRLLREHLFAKAEELPDSTLAAIAHALPEASQHFVRQWMDGPHYPALAAEWRMLRDYHAAWATSPYPPVFVTVDALVTCGGQHVLLIRRGQPPGQGLLALPGGFLDVHESLWHATLRELAEETGLQCSEQQWRAALRGVAVFDHPERSQRGRTLTHCHWFDLPDAPPPPVEAADDAADAAWVPLSHLGALEDQFHDDHFHILDHFLQLTP